MSCPSSPESFFIIPHNEDLSLAISEIGGGKTRINEQTLLVHQKFSTEEDSGDSTMALGFEKDDSIMIEMLGLKKKSHTQRLEEINRVRGKGDGMFTDKNRKQVTYQIL
jgi:hypothetical protein